MYGPSGDFTRFRPDRGPAMYLGYCGRTNRYRMMDLPEYLTNMQEGVSRLLSDASAAYQEYTRGASIPWAGRGGGMRARPGAGLRGAPGADARPRPERDCGCGCGYDDCHCDCCVEDADVLVHARCGETRRIPVTFENDTRRERAVTLQLERFATAGGRDLKWSAQLSETSFTLRACDEHTIAVAVQVRCQAFRGDTPSPDTPGTTDNPNATNTPDRIGSVDRCEVAYATLRAEGCLVRPVVLAVAVLPDDCDAYRHPCSCGCCH